MSLPIERATRRLGLLVTIVMLAGCGTTPPGGPDVLRVMTYNIHHGAGTDGVLDLERLAAVITAADPDLVALQEVDHGTRRTGRVDQAARLGELTGYHAVFGAAMPYDGGEYGEAVLSRVPIDAVRVHPLEASAGHEPRCALEVEVTLASGKTVRFVGTHFDHTRDPADRHRQAARVDALFASDGPPVIVAGDLNDTPDGGSIDALLDGWTVVDSDSTFPSDVPVRRIDYVLLRPGDGWSVLDAEVIDERVASDHRPLVVELSRP